MENTKNMSLGQNLRRIRKSLGLRQQEIVGEEITRNLISMIENGKSPMNYRIAQVASDNINKISEERGLGVYVAPEEIMNPQIVEAKKQSNKYIEELKNHIENQKCNLDKDYIKEITEFLNQWKIPNKKVEIYELLGDICYLNRDIKWEYVYLNKALENYYILPIKKDIHVLGRKLMASCIKNERYDEAITLSELDILTNDSIPKDFRNTIYYNKALSYKRLEEYDKALDMLSYIKEDYSENNEYVLSQALILKGTCHHEKGEKKKAIDVYKKIIDIFGEKSHTAGLAYSNIINNMRELDLKERVLEYRNKLLNILPDIEEKNNNHLISIYVRLAQMYEYLGDIELAEYYYISATNKALERKENTRCANILFKLLNLYNTTNQPEKILLKNSIFKKGFENYVVSDEMKLAFTLVLTNMKLDRKKEVGNIINHILDIDDER